MYRTVAGTYKHGRVELVEVPTGVLDDTPVIVTFLADGSIDLAERGVDEAQARELRARLERFAEDWDSPKLDIYDDYDAAKSRP